MATGSASTAATSFASLLKQSKFATYSPAIAQVYVTHGGHASRGDWGVKRPLSVRKRNRALMIQSMDSREQQTEFRSAEPEAKTIQRWEEIGMDVTPRESRLENSWENQYVNRPSRELAIDSEFSTYTAEDAASNSPASKTPALRIRTPPSIEGTPNFYTMSKKEFEKYLERVRKMRPAFRKYIQERKAAIHAENGKEGETEPPHLYQIRKENDFEDLTHAFLNEMAHEIHGDPSSQALEPYPHRNGGLFYPTPNAFQTSLLYPSIPARFTNTISYAHVVTAGGMVARVKPENNEDYKTLDWERKNLNNAEEVENEHPKVRFLHAKLIKPPETVATNRSPPAALSFSAPAASILRHKNPDLTTPPFTYPTGIKPMMMDIDAATVRAQTGRTNPYRPGSIHYSAVAPLTSAARLKRGPKAPPQASNVDSISVYGSSNIKRAKINAEGMVANLDALLSKMGPNEDKRK